MYYIYFFINQVTGNDDVTKTFLEVRDDTRRSAAIYKDRVLPLTESVVRHIGNFADSFLDFSFDEWVNILDDTISEIETSIGFCALLR